MNPWCLLGDPTKHNHGYDHVGSGTTAVAVGLVVERNPVAAPGILASAYLHVVRHHRGRPDGAGGIAGRDQHRASLESAAQPLHQAAQKFPQQRPQARSAVGLVGAGRVAAVPKPAARQWPAGPGRGWHQDPQTRQEMPAVKLLHQQSESNTKPEYIMGHSLQAVGLLVHAAHSVFCVPLAARIHEGLVWSNRDRRTLLDKMLGLLDILAIAVPYYFV